MARREHEQYQEPTIPRDCGIRIVNRHWTLTPRRIFCTLDRFWACYDLRAHSIFRRSAKMYCIARRVHYGLTAHRLGKAQSFFHVSSFPVEVSRAFPRIVLLLFPYYKNMNGKTYTTKPSQSMSAANASASSFVCFLFSARLMSRHDTEYFIVFFLLRATA